MRVSFCLRLVDANSHWFCNLSFNLSWSLLRLSDALGYWLLSNRSSVYSCSEFFQTLDDTRIFNSSFIHADDIDMLCRHFSGTLVWPIFTLFYLALCSHSSLTSLANSQCWLLGKTLPTIVIVRVLAKYERNAYTHILFLYFALHFFWHLEKKSSTKMTSIESAQKMNGISPPLCTNQFLYTFLYLWGGISPSKENFLLVISYFLSCPWCPHVSLNLVAFSQFYSF